MYFTAVENPVLRNGFQGGILPQINSLSGHQYNHSHRKIWKRLDHEQVKKKERERETNSKHKANTNKDFVSTCICMYVYYFHIYRCIQTCILCISPNGDRDGFLTGSASGLRTVSSSCWRQGTRSALLYINHTFTVIPEQNFLPACGVLGRISSPVPFHLSFWDRVPHWA